jgi:aminobenzoyl-glutamate utilization protein B
MFRLLPLFAIGGSLTAADEVLTRVAAHADRFGAIARQIWEKPELAFQETNSSAVLKRELRANGFVVQAGVARMPTAFVASWGSGKPVIALMGEFDALPGLSQKEVAVPSPVELGGAGHACGHNLLGAGSALAAVAIKEQMAAQGLRGTLRYYGTPAEERGGGKIYMIHHGLFRDVDAALYWHPNDANTVNLRSYLANNGGLFRFHGVASHAARAELGRSALDGAMIMLNAIEFLREHVPPDTRIHYFIKSGGKAPNVVPDLAEVELVARHPDVTVLNTVWERILKCAQAGALASDTRFDFEQGANHPNFLANDALTDVLSRALRKTGGYQHTPEEHEFAKRLQASLGAPVTAQGPESLQIDRSETPFPASGDPSDVSWVVPTAQMMAATYVPGVSSHTWQATACTGSTIGRKGMVVAARTLALAGIELFEDPSQVQAARAAFNKRRGDRMWITRIAPDAKPPLH